MRALFVDPVALLDVPEPSSAAVEETFGPIIIWNRALEPHQGWLA